jgi:hypothetical protein
MPDLSVVPSPLRRDPASRAVPSWRASEAGGVGAPLGDSAGSSAHLKTRG